jgi:hypothetical protein
MAGIVVGLGLRWSYSCMRLPRRPRTLTAIGGLLFAAASGPLDVACLAPPPLLLCGEIPEGGCPLGRGGTCDDAACAALYDCLEGDWTEVERCPDNAGGAGVGGGAAGAGGGTGAGGCTELVLDHTGEAHGCTPDLAHPDCPAVAAEGCRESACLTGCADFFLCKAGGWVDVAYCDEDGALVIIQP